MSDAEMIAEHPQQAPIAADDRRRLDRADAVSDQDLEPERSLGAGLLLDVFHDHALLALHRGVTPQLPAVVGEVVEEPPPQTLMHDDPELARLGIDELDVAHV